MIQVRRRSSVLMRNGLWQSFSNVEKVRLSTRFEVMYTGAFYRSTESCSARPFFF
jgi:hypothetical protein